MLHYTHTDIILSKLKYFNEKVDRNPIKLKRVSYLFYLSLII